jgi:hypothetical protein
MYARQSEPLPENAFNEMVHEHLTRLNGLTDADHGGKTLIKPSIVAVNHVE